MKTYHLLVPTILQALKEKDAGNEAYKKKDFQKALEHYDKAIEIDPANMTFYSNKAGKLLRPCNVLGWKPVTCEPSLLCEII